MKKLGWNSIRTPCSFFYSYACKTSPRQLSQLLSGASESFFYQKPQIRNEHWVSCSALKWKRSGFPIVMKDLKKAHSTCLDNSSLHRV